MYRHILVTTLAVFALTLFASGEAQAATRDCYTVVVDGVAKRFCEDAPAWEEWNDDGDHLFEWDCRAGGFDGCNPCGNCHRPPKPGTKPTFTALQHISKFKYSPKAGERIRWGDGDVVLVNQNNKLCVMMRSATIHCFPQNSFIAKNPKGDIVGVATPSTATTTPIKPPPKLIKPPAT